MNKASIILLLILTSLLTACSGSASDITGSAASSTGGGAAGELSASMQVALGTIELDGTENAVSAEQASELLPLWETLQVLESSDTAAAEEKEALISQIQETMTQDQRQAITALNLSRQDMFSIMQSRVQTIGGTQNNGTSQSGGTSTNRGSGFGPGAGEFMGPPPDGGGGFPGGNASMQGQRAQPSDSTDTSGQPASIDPSQIPTPLIEAVIEYLKAKAGS